MDPHGGSGAFWTTIWTVSVFHVGVEAFLAAVDAVFPVRNRGTDVLLCDIKTFSFCDLNAAFTALTKRRLIRRRGRP